jgi:raffinose/stachyose/melibiose transport system substrate-binding protein
MELRRHTVAMGVIAICVCLTAATAVRPRAANADIGEVNINLLYRITDPQNDEWVKWVAATFNQQNVGKIHLSYAGIPGDDYKPKIALVLQGKDPPDVFFSWEGGYAKLMIDSGFAAPLDQYFKQYDWTHQLNAAANRLATLEGHPYFVPYYMAASVVWYNTDIFKKYNLSPPETWDQLLRVIAVLKSHNVAPFLLGNQQLWEAQFLWTGYFVNRYGLETYNDLMTHKIKWTDPRVVAAFDQMKQWVDNGWFLKGMNTMDDDSTSIIFWKRQQAAMWYEGSFYINKFVDRNHQLVQPETDWFALPQIGNVKPTIEMFAESAWMMNKASAHPAAAAALLNFLVSKEAQQQMVNIVGPYASNASVGEQSYPPMVQRLGKVVSQSDGYTFMHIDHALPPAVAQPYLEELQGVLNGKVSGQQAAIAVEAAAARSN